MLQTQQFRQSRFPLVLFPVRRVLCEPPHCRSRLRRSGTDSPVASSPGRTAHRVPDAWDRSLSEPARCFGNQPPICRQMQSRRRSTRRKERPHHDHRSVEERSVEGLVLVPACVYMTREVRLPRKVFQQFGVPVVIDEDCLVLD